MYPRQGVHLPALALATVVALAVTFGVPAAMEHGAAPAPAITAQATPHTDADAVAVAPGTIRIEVVAQRPAPRKWSALMHWPAT